MSKKLLIFSFYIYFLYGCSDYDTHPRAASEDSISYILKLLNDYKIDDFYLSITQNNQDAVREKLEEESKSHKKSFNYGILLNAGLITEANKAIFKPNIKEIDYFHTVQNKMLCYMNSTFYNMANSAFFDDFLEIDLIFSAEWKNRDPQNLKIATPILRTLREVIYEIRLGENSTSDKIDYLRNRHIETLKGLNDLDIVSRFNKEIFESYKNFTFERNIGTAEIGFGVASSDKIHANIPNFNEDLVKEKTRIATLHGYFGYIGAMTDPSSSNSDIIYLRALFSMIDPAGSIARYISTALYEDGKAINLRDGFTGNGVLTFDIKENPLIKLKIFYTNIVDENYFINVSFVKPHTNEINGRIILYYGADQENENYKLFVKNFNLVAKSRVSTNHQISETYNYHKNQWQKHDFFTKPSFSNQSSPQESNGYKDFTLYFQANN